MSARENLLAAVSFNDAANMQATPEQLVDAFAAEVRREFAEEMAAELSGCCAECDACIEALRLHAEPEGGAA